MDEVIWSKMQNQLGKHQILEPLCDVRGLSCSVPPCLLSIRYSFLLSWFHFLRQSRLHSHTFPQWLLMIFRQWLSCHTLPGTSSSFSPLGKILELLCFCILHDSKSRSTCTTLPSLIHCLGWTLTAGITFMRLFICCDSEAEKSHRPFPVTCWKLSWVGCDSEDPSL